jgi:phospholipid/cholesterol/gamma-HCH transport system substrate-binding protein
MHSDLPRWRALANALFVLAVLGLAAFGVTRIAHRHWQGRPTFRARAEFPRVGGLESGAAVRVQGIDAGVVEAVEAPKSPGAPVVLVLKLDAGLRDLVRSDAKAQVMTQGVVGARVVEITPGLPDAPPLPEGGTLVSEVPVEVNDVLKGATEALAKMDEVAVAAREGLTEINAIAEGIQSGRGTLGRLVRDDEAYERLMSLSYRGERAIDDLDENLNALKSTWPLSRYFDRRGFSDRDRVLFHPEATCDRRVLNEADLFEPGRAVLTLHGRQRLDAMAPWFKALLRERTEVVIAAYHDDPRGDDLAELLSQQQAEAVRAYLVSHQGINAQGWFSSRKVAAVGFGKQVPRTAPEGSANQPPKRLEFLLFTPQG